jgi:branched-chain amino acid transport system permease protein
LKPSPVPRLGAVVGAWLALGLVMTATGGEYRLSLAVGAAILAIAAVGVDVCVGSAGLLVFSSPAFMLVGGLSSALVARHGGFGPTATTLVGLTAGLFAGAVLAVAVGAMLRRVHGIGVALVTLFVLQLVRGVARQQETFGGTLGLSGIPPFQIGAFRAASPVSQALVVMTALAAVLLAACLLVQSRRGLEMRATAGDAIAAAAAGVAVGRRRAEAFVFGSLCATLAGSLYAHALGYVSADAFNVSTLADLLLMVFLGGAGSVWGTVPGAVAVGFLPDLWLGPTPFDMLVRGAAFLAVLTLAPAGLAGVTRRLGRSTTRRSDAGRTAPPLRSGETDRAWSPEAVPGDGERAPTGVRGLAGPVLEATGLVQTFGVVRALDGVSLTVPPGEICAVIGANGAGKTTLFNLVSGHLHPDRGRIAVGGTDITRASPRACARLGVARTFQEVRLFPGLSVLEHVRVAAAGPEVARLVLDFTALGPAAGVIADELPFGLQRRVELARALAAAPALLLLDEPASGLSDPERADLVVLLRRLTGGPAVLLVEHDVAFALSVASRVIVLDAGRVLFDGPPDSLDGRGVLDTYLGRPARPVPRP